MSDTGEEIGAGAGDAAADDTARGRRRKGGRQGFSNPWLSAGAATGDDGNADAATALTVPVDEAPASVTEEAAPDATVEAAPAVAPTRRVWRFGDEFATPAASVAEDKPAEPVVAPVEVSATVISAAPSVFAEQEALPSPPVMPLDIAETILAVEPEPLPPLVLPEETVETVPSIEPEPAVTAAEEDVVHTAAVIAAPAKSIAPASRPWRESESFANPWGAQSAESPIEATPSPAIEAEVEVAVAAKLKPTRIAAPPMPKSGAFAPKSAEKRAPSGGVRRAETSRTVRVEGLGEGILSTLNESLGFFMGISKRMASSIMAGSAALGRMGSGNDARANRAPEKKRKRAR